MTAQEYSAGIKRLSWRYAILFCSVVLVGTGGALYLTDRLAASSSWAMENVFLTMLPALLAPTIIAGALLEYADRRIGLKCPSCGHSLSLGRHVRRLLRDGGACPWCRVVVVEAKRNAKPGAAPNGGPATPVGSSGVTEGPPSLIVRQDKAMRPFYLLLPFIPASMLVVWVGMDSFPLAVWNLCPLALAYGAILMAAGKEGGSRWAYAAFGVTSTPVSVLFHVAWLADWRGTASSSSTAGIGFVVIPIFAILIGFGCGLIVVVITHAIRLHRL